MDQEIRQDGGHQARDEQEKFLKRMNIVFVNDQLMSEAFTDRSWRLPGVKTNGRLAFFGDAVISVLVCEHVMRRFPYKEEGSLTNIRAELTRATTLAAVAETIGMESCICWRRSDSILKRRRALAEAFEAFVGALAVDQGYRPCRLFLRRVLMSRAEDLRDDEALLSPKNRFQKVMFRMTGHDPQYRVIDKVEDKDNPEYMAEVLINGKPVARARGFSPKEAEEAAAREALRQYAE